MVKGDSFRKRDAEDSALAAESSGRVKLHQADCVLIGTEYFNCQQSPMMLFGKPRGERRSCRLFAQVFLRSIGCQTCGYNGPSSSRPGRDAGIVAVAVESTGIHTTDIEAGNGLIVLVERFRFCGYADTSYRSEESIPCFEGVEGSLFDGHEEISVLAEFSIFSLGAQRIVGGHCLV